ncbi:hypothetical protein WA171_002067 [Blastocystis sp. BT1]
MDSCTLPFTPRYQRTSLCEEDLIPDLYEESKLKSRKKISAFLEKESYVMMNEFRSYKECGLKIPPYRVLIEENISVQVIKYIYDHPNVSGKEIYDHLWKTLRLTLTYVYRTKDQRYIYSELDKVLEFYCKYYSRFPDSIYGILEIHEPVIASFTEDGIIKYRPTKKELTEELICDCAKLDELYYVSQHLDLFNLDFCTNLIESSQETACRRLSIYIANDGESWSFLPRTYKLFESYLLFISLKARKGTVFELEYRLLLIRAYLKHYSHPTEWTSFLNPYTGTEIVFPPCLITPETCNPEFGKEGLIDTRFVSHLAPKEICFEAMVIDAMCFYEDKCATDQEILSFMKLNPFCLIDDEQIMLGTIRNVLWYLTSVNLNCSFTITYIPSTHKFKLTLKENSSYV